MKTRVIESLPQTPRIRSLTLAPVDRPAFPPHRAGSSTILRLRSGQRRNYSLCGEPADNRTWRIAVLREPDGRGASIEIHETVEVGDVLWASYAQPGIVIPDDARRLILIAGGVGVTGILGLMKECSRSVECEVHYCVRSGDDAAFLSEMRELPVELTLHRSDRAERLDIPALLRTVEPGTHVGVCGPARMVEDVERSMAAWPEGHLHVETFGAARPAVVGEPFDVELVAEGSRFTVGADETLLQALRSRGVNVDAACEAGVCRSCRVQVVDGTPLHGGRSLTAAERVGSMLACVSRGEGTLRLML